MGEETVASSTGPPENGAHAPRHLDLALVVVAAAQLMIVLDVTIVNVALPQMQRALGFSGAGLQWVVTAYSLAFGSLLLLGGRLGDLYGRRRIFITGVLVFALASLVGGFATSDSWLLTARAVQGAGAALAAPTALALIATTFPSGAPRNRALAVWAGMAGAGGAIGLLLAAFSQPTSRGDGCSSSTRRSARLWPAWHHSHSRRRRGSAADSTSPAS